MEPQEYPSHTTFHWQFIILDLWKVEIPGHLPVFSHLVSQKASRLVVQQHFYLRKTWERDTLAGYNGVQKTLSQINIISYHVYLNSGTSHGRLWKKIADANKRNMLNEEQRERREDYLLTTKHVLKELLIQEVPISDWTKQENISWAGAIQDRSLGLCSACLRGPYCFLLCCEFVWVSATGSGMASPLWDLVLDRNFPLKRQWEGPTEMHWECWQGFEVRLWILHN